MWQKGEKVISFLFNHFLGGGEADDQMIIYSLGAFFRMFFLIEGCQEKKWHKTGSITFGLLVTHSIPPPHLFSF